MSDHILTQPVIGVGPEQTLASCSFVTAGAGAITGFTGQGIVSATRTGVGTFDLLFAQGWIANQPISLNVAGAAAAITARPTVRAITRTTRKVTVATVTTAPADGDTTAVTIYCSFLITRNA
jgi:hypothetical protein